MTDKLLSQEEINALLNGGAINSSHDDQIDSGEQEKKQDIVSEFKDEVKTENSPAEVRLSEEEKDALGEIGNISFGSSATALSELLGKRVMITSPDVVVIDTDDLVNQFNIPHMAIVVEFIQGMSGTNLLIMKLKDAAIIADIMMGGDGLNPNTELTELEISAAGEAMNQMIASAATSMSTVFSKVVNISPPQVLILNKEEERNRLFNMGISGQIAVVKFKMVVESLIDSEIMQIVPLDTARTLIELLMSTMSMEVEGKPEETESKTHQEEPKTNEIDEINETVKTKKEAEIKRVEPIVNDQPMGTTQPKLIDPGHNANTNNVVGIDKDRLNLILDIPLNVSVVIGRTKKPIKEVLGMIPGSIVELEKLVDEEVEVYVNGTLAASGEVVVVNENFGVRITNIISPAERMQNLKK